MSTCLIELGTEELPPKALQSLSAAFTNGVLEGLAKAGLKPAGEESFASPRRLAMLLRDVPQKQQDQKVEKRGPALQAAFDGDGNPTKAVQGFARSCGVEVSELEQRETDKGTWLYYTSTQPGLDLEALLPQIVDDALAKLPIPKRMRWGDRADEFVRPVHWLLMMLDERVIEAELLGAAASNQTYGHRFHAPQAFPLQHAEDYPDVLVNSACVEPSFAKRKAMIREQVEASASQLGGQVQIDEDLLDEVTALVEWPRAVSGRFDEAFLEVPPEALVTTMQDNQKYFAVFDQDNRLMPHFITISNIDSEDPAVVSHGNERVIRPRFADAGFFWQQDRKVTLSSRLQSLEKVVFQQKLGSIGDKVIRIRALAGYLAELLGFDVSQAERAAELCKCDLMTDMVGEFPKLQGIMGSYYAHHDGEAAEVADAVAQHYWPRYAGDAVPSLQAGQVVALADRIDTMLGIFAIGQQPTGAKDPFGLRRAALGIIRIIVENGLQVDLGKLCQQSAQELADRVDASGAIDEVRGYIFDRLRAYYQDQGVRFDIVDAVLATRPDMLTDLDKRIAAVNSFLEQDAAVALAAANKRIGNILKKQEQAIEAEVDPSLLQEAAEQALQQQLQSVAAEAEALFSKGDYLAGLNQLAQLRPTVDRFFDEVMVMVEDERLRANRLALLQSLAAQFHQVADFSRIQ